MLMNLLLASVGTLLEDGIQGTWRKVMEETSPLFVELTSLGVLKAKSTEIEISMRNSYISKEILKTMNIPDRGVFRVFYDKFSSMFQLVVSHRGTKSYHRHGCLSIGGLGFFTLEIAE